MNNCFLVKNLCMKRLLLAILCYCLFAQGYSQLSIETAPLKVVNPWRPMAGVGVAYQVGNWKVRFSHYFGLRKKIEKRQISELDYQITAVELVHYFDIEANDNIHSYLGLRGSHYPEYFRKSYGYFLRDGNWYEYNDGVVNINKYDVQIIYGIDLPIEGRLRMYVAGGAGLRFRNVWHDASTAYLSEDFFTETLILPRGTRAGKRIFPALTLHFALEYTFAKNTK